MAKREAAENVGTKCCPFVRVLIHQLLGPFWILAPTPHDLDEARPVRIALKINSDVGAVKEGGFALVELRRLGPPLVLFGPIAVATGILFGFEAHHRDGPAIFCAPARATKPASGTGRKIS